MNDQILDKAATFHSLPAPWVHDLVPDIRDCIGTSGRKVMVIDDDPTGTQTVSNIPVLTEWSLQTLVEALRDDFPACYLLTNSRSLPRAAAADINATIGRTLRHAAELAGRDFVVVSRSDSTLRGHFPDEIDALQSVLGEHDAIILIPAFFDGGRYTIRDVHYVAQGDQLVPAAQTAFAADAAFGYRSSNLRDWVEEKTGGRIPATAVASISLDDLRRRGPDRVAERLLELAPSTVCIVNAAADQDLAVFTLGLQRAEAQGRRFLLRTAASIIPFRAGLTKRSLLSPDELHLPMHVGGLTLVGSYVPITSIQLKVLLERPMIKGIEVNVAAFLDGRRISEVARISTAVNHLLQRGEDVVVYTSRDLMVGADAKHSLWIGQAVSDGLVAIMRELMTQPRYVLAKGGITSHDIAAKGLGVRRAMIRGQLVPGVPVWELGADSRYPGLTYIVFPGNVGTETTLADVIAVLK